MIVVDLPPEHDDELCVPAAKPVFTLFVWQRPTTDAARLPA